MRKSGTFSSTLSVNEFALAATLGIKPLGVVSATFLYAQSDTEQSDKSGEIKPWGRQEAKAYQTVIAQLQKEAKRMGANGVCSVRLQRIIRKQQPEVIELTAIGTAYAETTSATITVPAVSLLSGQELYALRQAGYAPIGIAFGVCAYLQVAHLRVETQARRGLIPATASPNIERSDFTRGLYAARQRAMERLHQSVTTENAAGVLGITTVCRRHAHDEAGSGSRQVGRMTIEFTVYGTVIGRIAESEPTLGHALFVS